MLGDGGYGDAVGTDLTAFISDEMRSDWKVNREELISFGDPKGMLVRRALAQAQIPDSLCRVHTTNQEKLGL